MSTAEHAVEATSAEQAVWSKGMSEWCVRIANGVLIQLNPAIAYVRGVVKIMLYSKVFSIANM